VGGVASHGSLLALVRERGGLSRRQLLDETGMSRGTLVGRLDALTRLGLVYEAESLGATGGRRARRIRFDDRGRVVLTVGIGHTHARVSVTDLLGSELRRADLPLHVDAGADAVLGPALDLAEKLVAAGQAERLAGVGVGVPAAVDPHTGWVLHPTTLPGWEPDAVVTAVRSRFGRPVVVENDARAAAVGECRSDTETLVAVKVATGIGCGIVVGGDVLRGAAGVAGDIGHGFRTLADVVADLGHPAVRSGLAEAADVLGAALATTVTTVNPHRVVLGGTLGVLPPVVDGVRARVLDAVTERARPAVEASTLGGRATPRGLARLVVRRVFDPDAVDELVALGAAPGG
jgi:predicted NBD/HSP70 family sugar kinase